MISKAEEEGSNRKTSQAGSNTARPQSQFLIRGSEPLRPAQIRKRTHAQQQEENQSGNARLRAELRIGVMGFMPVPRDAFKISGTDTHERMIRGYLNAEIKQIAPHRRGARHIFFRIEDGGHSLDIAGRITQENCSESHQRLRGTAIRAAFP